MTKLTPTNYYTNVIDQVYMSASQFKSFRSCEARTLAEIKGEWTREASSPMLVGSYVDAYFTQDLEAFKSEHPEIFLKDGVTLRSDFRGANDMIERAERDSAFMSYLDGEPQRILTGEIAGVPFKAMLDVVNDEKHRIVDLKTTRDFGKTWNDRTGEYTGFIEAWRYDLQGAVYRELMRQKTGKTYDFYIAAITREKVPDIGLFSIPSDALDDALHELESLVGRFSAIKEGFVSPTRCETCDYCKSTRVLGEPIDFRFFSWR